MRSRDLIVTIAHPASTIRPGQRFDSTLLSCKKLSIWPGVRTERRRGYGSALELVRSPSRLTAGKTGLSETCLGLPQSLRANRSHFV
jgi:hypothetical protein